MNGKYKRDDLGNRMKLYESKANSESLLPNLPVIVRLDGNNFSKFTQGLERPYDVVFSDLMKQTTEFLVQYFNKCVVGYTQSDEITLVFYNTYEDPIEFSGRIQKLCSIIASKCTCFFALKALEKLPEKNIGVDQYPVFDCRVWNVPSWVEASNTILWREVDASKNSVQMAAQTYLNHKAIQGISNKDVQKILLETADINWNDYPDFFKKGSYFVRYQKEDSLRNGIKEQFNMPPLTKIDLADRLGYLFPLLYSKGIL